MNNFNFYLQIVFDIFSVCLSTARNPERFARLNECVHRQKELCVIDNNSTVKNRFGCCVSCSIGKSKGVPRRTKIRFVFERTPLSFYVVFFLRRRPRGSREYAYFIYVDGYYYKRQHFTT